MVYGQGEHEVFLGRDYTNTPSYSDNVAAEIDNEIRTIVETAFEQAETLLKEHIDQLHLIAKYLMKNEKIDGIKFEKLMKGELPASDFEDDVKDTVQDIDVKDTVEEILTVDEDKDTVDEADISENTSVSLGKDKDSIE